MIGLIQWGPKGAGRNAEEAAVLRMRFLRVPVYRGKGEIGNRRRAAAAAGRLKKLGIERAVFPESFPYLAIFAKRGVFPVETIHLRRALAAEWLRAELAAKQLPASATVAVLGGRLTGELVRTVTELCLHHRYVLLEVDGGAEELARQLRREYGVPLVLRPTAEQIAAADAALLFTERTGCENPVVLPLYDRGAAPEGLHLTLPPPLEERLPPECCREQLFAALIACGVLRPAQIQISVAPGA